jgi:hypothetical protein
MITIAAGVMLGLISLVLAGVIIVILIGTIRIWGPILAVIGLIYGGYSFAEKVNANFELTHTRGAAR